MAMHERDANCSNAASIASCEPCKYARCEAGVSVITVPSSSNCVTAAASMSSIVNDLTPQHDVFDGQQRSLTFGRGMHSKASVAHWQDI